MIHIGELIHQKLNEEGKTAPWLAEQLNIPLPEVLEMLGKRSMDADTLILVSQVIKYNFFQDYSNALAQMKSEE